jgi:hypothetical protein
MPLKSSLPLSFLPLSPYGTAPLIGEPFSVGKLRVQGLKLNGMSEYYSYITHLIGEAQVLVMLNVQPFWKD